MFNFLSDFSVFYLFANTNGKLALWAELASTSLSPTIIVLFKSPPIDFNYIGQCRGSGLLKANVSEPTTYSKYLYMFNFFKRSIANLSCLLVQTPIEIFFFLPN